MVSSSSALSLFCLLSHPFSSVHPHSHQPSLRQARSQSELWTHEEPVVEIPPCSSTAGELWQEVSKRQCGTRGDKNHKGLYGKWGCTQINRRPSDNIWFQSFYAVVWRKIKLQILINFQRASLRWGAAKHRPGLDICVDIGKRTQQAITLIVTKYFSVNQTSHYSEDHFTSNETWQHLVPQQDRSIMRPSNKSLTSHPSLDCNWFAPH